MKYIAATLDINGMCSIEEITKLAKVSWVAMGIYQYLIRHGAKSPLDLVAASPSTPMELVCDALEELIALELVKGGAE